jgi:hypothetical protein
MGKICRKARECLFGIGRRKIFRDVAMAFEDVDDFEAVFGVAKDDDVIFEGDRTQLGPEIGTGDSHLEWKRCKMTAVGPNFLGVSLGYAHTLSGFRDVFQDFYQVGLGCRC